MLIHAHTHAHTYAHAHMHMHMHIHTSTCAHTGPLHTCTHMRAFMHTHTHTHNLFYSTFFQHILELIEEKKIICEDDGTLQITDEELETSVEKQSVLLTPFEEFFNDGSDEDIVSSRYFVLSVCTCVDVCAHVNLCMYILLCVCILCMCL